MEVVVAKTSGLCYGVRRALAITRKIRRQEKGSIVTFGDLIHNPQVISNLKAEGIDSVDNLSTLRSGIVIIRSHGVAPEVYDYLKQRKIRIIDATCPIVKRIQQLVSHLARKNEEIIIVGNKNHPETTGLAGYSRGKGRVVENEEQVNRLPYRASRAVVSQSTADLEIFQKIIARLVEKTGHLNVFNTICHSTLTRQKSAAELALKADVMFVVGGKRSSNTNKLYEMCRKLKRRTFFIENAKEIKPKMIRGAEIIGISGGASTPREAIQEAVNTILRSFSARIN